MQLHLYIDYIYEHTYVYSLGRHLPPQEERHDDQHDAEAAEDDPHQHGQIVIVVRLTQQWLQLFAVRLQLDLKTGEKKYIFIYIY